MEFDLGEKILEKINSLAEKILEKIPGDKRRIFIFSAAGLLIAAICLTIVIFAAGGKKPETSDFAGARIPAEELFYPAEPDFLPMIIPERERRQNWTAEDALPFWTDPAKDSAEKWRGAAEAVIDRLMEGVL